MAAATAPATPDGGGSLLASWNAEDDDIGGPTTTRLQSSSGVSRSGSRGGPEIRFKDIAKFVGQGAARSAAQVSRGPREVGGSRETSRGGDLPPVVLEPSFRPERAKCQLEWLRAEQRAEQDQVKKLESSLSDSRLLEVRAKRRAAKQQELCEVHVGRLADVERKIHSLRDRLSSSHSSSRPVAAKPGREQKTTNDRRVPAAQLDCPGEATGTNSGCTDPPPGAGMLMRSTAEVQGDAPCGLQQSTRPGGQQSHLPQRSQALDPQSHGQPDDEFAPTWQAFDSTCSMDSTAMMNRSSSRRSVSRKSCAEPFDSSLVLPTPEEDAEIKRESRQRIREELKYVTGDAREAFKKLDLNGSGNLSCQEFADGVSRMGINWQQITGMARPRELFNLFDEDKDFKITFSELFPEDIPDKDARPSTPDFWRLYNRSRDHLEKHACWLPASCEDELGTLQEMSMRSEEAQSKRKWMRSTMQRLKTRGKSDGRCREVVAMHLPRGTGPKDREGVSTFTKVDLKNCKKMYSDEVNLPMRRMWKVVGDYKDQRREQKRLCEKLYAVTGAQAQRPKNEENLHQLAGGLSLLGKFKDDAGGGASTQKWPPPGLDETDVDGLRRDFERCAGPNEQLSRGAFAKLLHTLQGQSSEQQLDTWFEQVLKQGQDVAQAKSEDSGKEKRKTVAAAGVSAGMGMASRASVAAGRPKGVAMFEQFCWWYAEHQARRP